MLKEDFISNITMKWSVGPRAEKSEARNKLLFDELYTFCKYCPEIHLEDMFHYLSRKFKSTGYKPIPEMSLLYGYAYEMDFIPEDKKPKKKKKPYWCCCKKCGKEYGFRGRGCPVCGSLKYYVYYTDFSIPEHVELIQEDCTICKKYPKRNEDKNYIFGPECNSFGLGTRPFDNCKDCGCRGCCNQYFLLIDSSKRAKDKFSVVRKKMPWIDEEKLNIKITKKEVKSEEKTEKK